ncbi:hypothetical protein [Flagellimonas sp. C4]|uniref:hypothetical protein n=1 Tax=Flagellimonas alginolytica TaxID=3177515 RepID=UPI0035C91918
MKNLIYLSLIVLTTINVGCTAEPVTNQDDEISINYEIEKIKENAIENEEVKDSDI